MSVDGVMARKVTGYKKGCDCFSTPGALSYNKQSRTVYLQQTTQNV